MHAGVEPWLADARGRRTEAVLSVAEGLECGPFCAGAGPSPLLYRALVTAYLVQNDVLNATWALRRWAVAKPAGGDEQQDRVRESLERVAQHCGRYAYSEAFREAAAALLGNAAAEGVTLLGDCLLDYLAARHTHQRRTFYGEDSRMEKHASELGVTPADLEVRLQRVRDDGLQRIEGDVGDDTNERLREALCCMMEAGRVV
ncbi:hypothetical protein DQ04_04141030 [Trypanosoma grayi]|uniref:hypothetical protein n=1 Tax=Trypanosoma grayi TaxID=71804 RepID=UPI0004F41794|nr:hypothetical protein DQ04_04141030 [Trypanosoma grayi]KEG10126.1 hypothetical protein DQ04_04141030 [Trypanosoma grayi]